VALTEAGRRFQPEARETLRRLNQARDEARQAGREADARLAFAATHALSLTFFPDWLRKLEKRQRFGAIRLLSDSMRACEDALLQGQAEFLLCHGHAIVANRLPAERFHYQVLAEDRLVPVSAPAADGRPRFAIDSGAEALPQLTYSDESGMGRIVAGVLAAREAGTPKLRAVFISPLATMLQAMARDGRGLAWLPMSLLDEDLAHGALVAAGDADWSIPVEIRLYRPRERLSAAAEGFWSLLETAN
jgi:DNA-binding transcriptional LysR family regulator